MANPVSLSGTSAAGASTSSIGTTATTGTTAGNTGVVKSTTSGTDAVNGSDDANLTPAAKAKLQLNASIVQASLTVSIGAQDAPLSLVYKTALTSINEALKSDFGDDAIQNAVSQDNTPEGTASRIVALSTAFYESYKRQHPGQDDDATLQKFMDTIQGGMEKGFKEARDILQGLNVLGGDIASNIDKTYALVQKGYADFQAAQQKPAAPAEAAKQADSVPA